VCPKRLRLILNPAVESVGCVFRVSANPGDSNQEVSDLLGAMRNGSLNGVPRRSLIRRCLGDTWRLAEVEPRGVRCQQRRPGAVGAGDGAARRDEVEGGEG